VTAGDGAGGRDAEPVTCEVVVPAPPAEVFRWFVEPDLLARWIGIRAALEPRPGGRFRFEITDGQWCSGSYLEAVPGRRVVFTWGWDSGAIPVPPGSSTVEVDLREHPDGTHVWLVHRDLAPEVRPLHAEGWGRFLPRLAAVVGGRDPGTYPTKPGGGPVAIDTTAVIRVGRPREQVAAYLRDPVNDPAWIGGVRTARLVTAPPVAEGSQVERVASFLGRRIEYVNEVTRLTPERLAMRSVRSPFPMRVTYEFHDAGDATTEVSVRVEGEPVRRYGLADPLLTLAVRRSVQRDLRTLKRLLENGTG
jgi:uncharacterized protein YndB with AHSA1/START domain/uncharacterized membrane protein